MSGLLVSALALVFGPGIGAAPAQTLVPPPAARVVAPPDYAVPVPRGVVDAGRPPLRLAVAASAMSRDYVVALSTARQRALTTTLGYRIAPNGPIGSIGFPPSDDTPYVDRAFLNPAASMGFVRPEVVVGVRVDYRF